MAYSREFLVALVSSNINYLVVHSCIDKQTDRETDQVSHDDGINNTRRWISAKNKL